MIYFHVIINLYLCQHYYFLGIIVFMESNKTNLKLLYLRQINKKWLLSSNGPLQFAQSVLSDKKSLNKCAFRLLASFLN
jgi:hypothetical protein